MPTIEAHGISVDVPAGWDAEIYVRPDAEEALPVLHLATFALLPGRGDFGGGAVERMGRRDIFISLSEYGAESVGTALFEATSLTPIRPAWFDMQALQRPLASQSGWQRFATLADRPFCLYVVLGHHGLRHALADAASTVVDRIQVTRR